MRSPRLIRARLRALARRDAIAGEIRDELEFHLQSRIEQYEREGYSAAEARRKALSRVGNLAIHQDRGYDVSWATPPCRSRSVRSSALPARSRRRA